MIAPTPLTQVVIRFSERGDERALTRIAGRDSQPVPRGALLLAEADGELRAALPLDGRGAVSDPFYRTAELVRLLELRRAQLRAPAGRGRRRGSALRAAFGWAPRLAPSVAGRLGRR